MRALIAIYIVLMLSSPPVAAQVDDNYHIGPADVLRISVWNDESLSGTVPVRPDGMISLPLLNDVQASGLTPLQLRESLIELLGHYMPAPEVSVIVEQVRSYAVSVLGQVANPGRYELQRESTVLEVIAEAGGFTEFADSSRITILRNNGGQREQIPFNYKGVVSRRGRQENLVVLAGDVIVVP